MRNFDRIPREIRGLLPEVVLNSQSDFEVALAIEEDYDRIPKKLRKKLLLALENKNPTEYLLYVIKAKHLDDFPKKMKKHNKALRK